MLRDTKESPNGTSTPGSKKKKTVSRASQSSLHIQTVSILPLHHSLGAACVPNGLCQYRPLRLAGVGLACVEVEEPPVLEVEVRVLRQEAEDLEGT